VSDNNNNNDNNEKLIVLTDASGNIEEPEPAAEADAAAAAYHVFDKRWEPAPDRGMYDYEVCALVNRDVGVYINSGCAVDSPEDVDLFVQGQLEKYADKLSTYQAEYYRMTLNALLFNLVQQMIQQAKQRDGQINKQMYNQVMAEMNKPRKGARGRNND
jgi:hypothetical protein